MGFKYPYACSYSIRFLYSSCYFFHNSNIAESSWSVEGVSTKVIFEDEENGTFDVYCESSHLTSFAVLLDVNNALTVSKILLFATEIIFYAGNREQSIGCDHSNWLYNFNFVLVYHHCILDSCDWVSFK